MRKNTYELKNLNCAHCAGVIDLELKKIENLEKHSLNFLTKELKVEIKDEFFKETVIKIKETILRIEDVVEIIEKDTKTVKFRLENLFCQSCSLKIEKTILELDFISDGFYNFSTQILTLTVPSSTNSNKLQESIQKIVDSIEDGVIVRSSEIPETKNEIYVENKKELFFNIFGAILFVILISFESLKNNLPLFLLAYFLVGSDVLLKSIKNIKNKNPFDENFLMSLATIGAFGIKEYPEAVAVMLFYKVGEFFQSKAVSKSRKSIESLLNIKPQWANVLINGLPEKVKPDEVSIGNTLIVYPGETVPLDGIITKGHSNLDTSALTGESLPLETKIGNNILSGSININSTIELKVSKTYSDSTVSKILDLVENAGIKKAKTEKFITSFSRYYTPFVVFSAIFVAFILPVFLGNFNLWFYRALIFLVISCPCALVVSIPLGYFGGIGRASKHGILVKGSNYLEALTKVNKIILDKTGTLTNGTFVITEIHGLISEKELLETAIIGENGSNHPLALAIKNSLDFSVSPDDIKTFEVLQGYGTKTQYKNDIIFVGNKKLMNLQGIFFENSLEHATIIHVAKNNIYLGYIMLSDQIKKTSHSFVEKAKSLGIELIMLSGDNETSCNDVATNLGIKKYFSSLLPQDKVALVEKELGNKNTTIFVGDGINDAPVLKRVDIGISMGGVGSDAAIEASDIVLMDDNLLKVISAIEIAKKTKKIVIQNIVFALGIKIIILSLGLNGHATMWEAIFADVGVALIAIFNSIRALRD